MKTHLLAAVAAVAVSATPAFSESGLYFGVGVGMSSAHSNDGVPFPTSSADDFALLGATVGYRMDTAGFFFGGELDADLALKNGFKNGGTPCSVVANAAYVCETDSTARLRAVLGSDFGNGYEGFVTAGYAQVNGSSAIAPNATAHNRNDGFTVGIGVQRDLSATGGKLRAELIYDEMDRSATKPAGFDPDYRAATLKFSYIFGK